MNALTETWKRVFGKVTPLELAARELADAELRLLEAQSGVEYAQAIAVYNQARIKRLRAFIASQADDVKKEGTRPS